MKKIILLCLFAVCAILSVNAEQTAYEKKVKEICTKYYCYGKYGYNGGLDMGDVMTIAMYGPEEAAKLMLLNYALTYDARQGDQWAKNMKKELENAKSLMTDADFYRIFLETTYGQAMTVVKELFDAKFVKDEFETHTQFKERVKNDAEKEYDRLCGKLVANMNTTLKMKISPVSYNAERGEYQVSVKESAKFSGDKGMENSYNIWLPMPADQARQFKGYDLNSENIISVDWINVNDTICVGVVSFKDIQGDVKKFTLGQKGSKPLVFAYDKYKEANPLLPGHVWAASNLKSYDAEYAKRLVAVVDDYNKSISEDKYFTNSRADEYYLNVNKYSLGDVNKYDEEWLQYALDEQKRVIEKDYEEKVAKMKNDCKKFEPDKFISLYAVDHPDFAEKVAALEEDYKCYEYSYNTLAFFVIDDWSPEENKCIDEYLDLFNNKEEFYSFYSDVTSFNQEVETRLKVQSKFLSIMGILNRDEKLSFKGARDSDAPNVAAYINALEDFKIMNMWYEKALDAYFDADAKMMKEYEKVGSLFESKGAFFQSYISSSYKQDLKAKKTAHKQ